MAIATCWGSMARPLNIHGHSREGSGGQKIGQRGESVEIFFGGARIFVPGPIDLAGGGTKAVGGDPESIKRPMPDHQADVERLRERCPKRWMASATATRTERAVIERGIGPGGFCSRHRWAGRNGRTDCAQESVASGARRGRVGRRQGPGRRRKWQRSFGLDGDAGGSHDAER